MMTSLDAGLIRQLVNDAGRGRLAELEAFTEIDSTNSYLMRMPGPSAGQMSVAVTDNQTAGRGRHGKSWQSPRGSGLCLSVAYTFASQPASLPAVTLALGLAALDALLDLGIGGVELKWPNDLVAMDGKLGGILTEAQQRAAGAVTIVSGIGINIDVGSEVRQGSESAWSRQVIDLKRISDKCPQPEEIAARLVSHFSQSFVDFEARGFAPLVDRWSEYDWLRGREITVDTAIGEISGLGTGVAEDGALLVESSGLGMQRVTSGNVKAVGARSER